MNCRPLLPALMVAAGMMLFAGVAAADQHQQEHREKALLMKASEMSGLDVRNKQNRELGDISDLIVNVEKGAVTHVIVSSGGFLGLGDRLLPVPLSAAHFQKQEGEPDRYVMVLDLRQEDVERAPSIEQDKLSELEKDEWSEKLNRFYRIEKASMLSDAGEGDLKRCSELAGKTLMNDAGEEELGEINEIVFAVDDGDIRYAALSFGGMLGFGDKLFAVPWDSLAFAKKADAPAETILTVTADVSKEKLAEMKGFTEESWPQEADMRWAQGAERTAARPDGTEAEVK